MARYFIAAGLFATILSMLLPKDIGDRWMRVAIALGTISIAIVILEH